jgi:hypothetical protein
VTRVTGFFVDLAAYDAVAYSNSYVLERDYGWSGICVEPQAKHILKSSL